MEQLDRAVIAEFDFFPHRLNNAAGNIIQHAEVLNGGYGHRLLVTFDEVDTESKRADTFPHRIVKESGVTDIDCVSLLTELIPLNAVIVYYGVMDALLTKREIVVVEEGRRNVEDFGDNHDGEEARVYSQGLRLVTSRRVRRNG